MSNYFDQFSKYDLPVFEQGVRLPEIKIPAEDKAILGLKPDASNADYLKKLCWTSCKQKIADGVIKQSEKECIERLKMEFGVFDKTGVIDYLLLLRDIFGWCDQNKIARGPGRGSACGSLALYLVGLTKVNPLDHNLNFTRFLSEARAKPHYIDGVMYLDGKTMADFDGDISFLGRDKVIKRLENDYSGKTCKIATSQYLTGKMALKDTLKSGFGYHDSDARAITDMIESVYGKVKSLTEAYNSSPSFKAWADKNPKIFKTAKKLEGLYRTKGIHASGVLISFAEINTMMPMELSDSNEIVSGYDMDSALTMFVKGDLLGLRTLDVIEEAAKVAGINSDKIDIHDKSIYDFFQNKTQFYGLFQIEDGLTKQVTIKVKPKNIDQLAACLSISRPGALKQIPDYVKFVETGEFKKVYPAIDEILVQTGGILLYQEQINNICQSVYKLSPVDADQVRRAIGKKLKDDMAPWEAVLYKNGKENNVPEEITKWFWDTCNASSDYLFNASHCLSPDSVVETETGDKLMFEVKAGEYIKSFDVKTGKDIYTKVLNIMENEKELYEIELDDGKKISASMDHKFLCEDMEMHALKDIIKNNYKITTNRGFQNINFTKKLGLQKCLDFSVEAEDHNFYANGIVVSNCFSYAYITCYTVYLKQNHPLAFYLACLKLAQYETDPMSCIGSIQKEMRESGFQLLPPNIYKSSDDYSIDGNNILMGFSSIKGLSEKALDKLHSFSYTGKNKFQLFAAAKEAKVPINILTALIMSGCLPTEHGESRSKLVLEAETYGLLTDKEKPIIERLGPDYKFDLLTIIKDCVLKLKDEKGKPLIKESRFETIKRDYEDYKLKFQRNTRHELLCAYIMESEYLGFSYSTNLKQIYSQFCQDLMNLHEIQGELDGARVRMAVRVLEVENRVSREKKKKYLKLLVRDETGTHSAMLFGDENIQEAITFNGREVKEDDIVILNAAKKGDALFINSVSIQENPIVIKRADLKKDL
jgi:DNA polymerase III alpha subunit